MTQLFANNASNSLVSAVTASATTMTLHDADAFPAIAGGDWYYVTLSARGADGSEVVWEIVKVIAKASDTLTVERAQEGTAARDWLADTSVELRVTAAALAPIATARQPGDVTPISDGGTGATTATQARTNLGLGSAAEASSATFATAGHTHGTYDYSTLLSGSTVFSRVNVTDGIVSSITTRDLSAGDVGAAATSHSHSTYDNSTTYSGSTVPSQIRVTDGIVTGITTRNLTASDVGAAPSSHSHSTYDNSTTYSGSTVPSRINVTDGIVSSITTRNLTASDVGATPHASALSYVSSFDSSDRFPLRTSSGLDRYTTWSRIEALAGNHVVTGSNIWSYVQSFRGGARLGEQSLALKVVRLSGTTSSTGGDSFISHGLTASKILSWTIHIEADGMYFQPGFGAQGDDYFFKARAGATSFVSTSIGSRTRGKPIWVFVWYEA